MRFPFVYSLVQILSRPLSIFPLGFYQAARASLYGFAVSAARPRFHLLAPPCCSSFGLFEADAHAKNRINYHFNYWQRVAIFYNAFP